MRRLFHVESLGLVIALLVSAESVRAQYRFDHWTTDDGLPQNSVYAITQTRDGYLWLATVDGLVRFDGVHFRVFDQNNSRGLTSNRFTCLFEDAEGTLWSGTEDGGLTRYRNGQFKTFTTADGLPTNEVKQIQTNPAGGLLIATTNGWVTLLNDKFSPYSAKGSWYDLKIRFTRSGSEWHYDQAGLHELRNGGERTFAIHGRVSDASLFESRDGSFWAGIPTQQLVHITNGQLQSFTTRDGLPALPADAAIGSFVEDQQGSLWLGSANGLVRYRDGRFTTYTMANGLSSNGILSLFADREGTIWIGTTTGGLNRLTRQFITSYSTRDGLAGDSVYPIYEDRDGVIWIGTHRLCFFKDGVIKNLAGDSFPLALTDVQAIGQDADGRVWISSYEKIAYVENGRIVEPPQVVKNIPGAQAIYTDRQRNVWFGSKDGLFKLAGDVLTAYTTQDGLPGKDIKVIHQDGSGTIWIGTYDGLARFKDGAFISFTIKDGLGSNRVRSIYEDADGILWIGTYDGGLSRLKDGRITPYKVTEGLFNNGVFQILEDARGNFWISSNRGIYRVSRQQLNDFAAGRVDRINCIAYGKLDGMLNTECNGGRQPAGVKARDGKLWFPTQGGVVVIDPEAVPFNNQPPPVLIEAVQVDGAPIDFAGGLSVKPGQASLEIHFTGLSFIKPEQVRFKYQLIGQDADWVDAGTRRTVNYSYLPPGRYTFQVIATNSDGVWNNQPALMRIQVLPPFYRTWWFVTIALLALIGLGAFAYTVRVNQLKRLNEARAVFSRQLIDSQEDERKRIAAELHDSIGQELLIIKNRAALGLKLLADPARAQEQIEQISGSASQAITEVRQIAYDLRPHHLDAIGLTQSLEELVDRVAGASQINLTAEIDNIDDVGAQHVAINIYRIVQEGLNNLVKHSQAEEAKLSIK
ncbi:MAG TPA: two-component regulator propeller domain-containing protein, partial [Pyrinomonadaceae bacterium]|nr:two-component regulator propeller domain-containing protein [Pyrinomonadaceae bacterium]